MPSGPSESRQAGNDAAAAKAAANAPALPTMALGSSSTSLANRYASTGDTGPIPVNRRTERSVGGSGAGAGSAPATTPPTKVDSGGDGGATGPVSGMSISEKGVRGIIRSESFSELAYPDPAGQTKTYSIGYGTQLNTKELRDKYGPGKGTITEPEAHKLLMQRIHPAEARIRANVKVPLSQDVFDSLVDLGYNYPAGLSSKLFNQFNSGDFHGARETIKHDNHITVNGSKQVDKGLTNRRLAEIQPIPDTGPSLIPNPASSDAGTRMAQASAMNSQQKAAMMTTPAKAPSMIVGPQTTNNSTKNTTVAAMSPRSNESTYQRNSDSQFVRS